VHFCLERWLWELEIDTDRAMRWVSRQTGRKEFLSRLSVEAIQERNFGLKTCEFGRVHSNVSNLASPQRRCLRWRGERLAELDIRNTQPLLISHLALRAITGDFPIDQQRLMGFSVKRTESGRKGERQGGAGSVPNPHVGMFSLRSEMTDSTANSIPQHLLDLITSCERGEFYETMAAVWHEEGLTREKIEGISVWLLFDKTHLRLPYWRALRKAYPAFADYVTAMKKPEYRTLARAAQRFESLLMIVGAVGRLTQDHPDIPIWTVHDSILTLPTHIETVRAVILDEFSRCGIVPAFKCK
jgi:hypothetical protein